MSMDAIELGNFLKPKTRSSPAQKNHSPAVTVAEGIDTS